MPSERVVALCNSPDSVTTTLAAGELSKPVSAVVKQLFKSKTHSREGSQEAQVQAINDETDELSKAERCGKFPYKPSRLFLQIYNDVLSPLERDPLAGVVSPSLLGSSGVVPLSVVSVIPDIMRHYAELIVSAQHEVFLATNYWQPSHSATIVSDSLRELSKRAKSRDPNTKVVVKFMYDRGNMHQVIKNHTPVKPSEWSKVELPTEDELPGVSLEVVNYHRPALGTFHAKYLVVDRRVACLNSNNIQDRPNVEMMVHFEGPIVDSFYDMALLSWSNALNPPLPLLAKPPTWPETYSFNHENGYLKYIDAAGTSKATRRYLAEQHAVNDADDALDGESPPGANEKPSKMDHQAAEDKRSQLIAEHPNMMVPHDSFPSSGASASTSSPKSRASDLDSTSPNGASSSLATSEVPAEGSRPPPKTNSALKDQSQGAGEAWAYDKEIADGKESGAKGAAGIAMHLNFGKLDLEATVKDSDILNEFRPHILHEPHAPCPMAMVNRQPIGTPGHDEFNPQDLAWLAAMKYAQKNVFIQTPTFNASPMIPATLAACRRGIEVTLYLDLGFNDQGEMIPFQGGTNEQVVNTMYKTLNAEGKGDQKHLRVFWYTGKDQKRPISAAEKKRNCHVKFMSVDDQIAILGNGNQDTQSWFHSQEINVLIDSPELVKEWRDGIDANQNTAAFGRVDEADGVWRAPESGEAVQASGVQTAGMFGRLKGLSGAVGRMRGTGGF
ncbi:hypothetical protein OF83DRAFT_1171920 [Amylostereum chailletii]|nr:hypothetical protein OF83DRAFT_1171920 [Amylostereum chailletii]